MKRYTESFMQQNARRRRACQRQLCTQQEGVPCLWVARAESRDCAIQPESRQCRLEGRREGRREWQPLEQFSRLFLCTFMQILIASQRIINNRRK
jgi:hypothetical protein